MCVLRGRNWNFIIIIIIIIIMSAVALRLYILSCVNHSFSDYLWADFVHFFMDSHCSTTFGKRLFSVLLLVVPDLIYCIVSPNVNISSFIPSCESLETENLYSLLFKVSSGFKGFSYDLRVLYYCVSVSNPGSIFVEFIPLWYYITTDIRPAANHNRISLASSIYATCFNHTDHPQAWNIWL